MLAALLLLALHAPRPLAPARPPAQPSPVGEWVLEWKGAEGPATFAPGGGFACVWAGRYWIRTWTMADGVLAVDEHLPAANEWGLSSQRICWAARLRPGTLEGPLADGGDFKLRKKPAR
jgi:hypothetical protein